MDNNAMRFVSEVVRPWELLNKELSKSFSLNPTINDYTTRAYALAVSIKHTPEANQKAHLQEVLLQARPYEVISDLADSFKHGILRNSTRQCTLVVGSMFERNSDAKVRFLRNRVTIRHNTHGKIDFMKCSQESALLVSRTLALPVDWSPIIRNNSGDFSDEIRVHASKSNQVDWTGMQLEFVQSNDIGELVSVELNGTVKFVLTADV
jgi:hypothetical protein